MLDLSTVSLSLPVALGVSTTALSIGFSYFVFDKLYKVFNPDISQSFLSDSLDFDRLHDDGETLIGREGSLTRTFVIDGCDYGMCSEDNIKNLLKRRAQFFDAVVAKEGIRLSFISKRIEEDSAIVGEFDHPILQTLHDKWQTQFKTTYRNSHYLVLSEDPSRKGKIKTNPVEKGRFDDICHRIQDFFSTYGIRPLKGFTGDRSELLSFWSSLINGKEISLKSFSRNLAERMVGGSIGFDPKTGIINFDDEKYAGIVSINTWGEESSTNMFKELSYLPGESLLFHSVEGVPKTEALAELKKKEAEEGGLFGQITQSAFEQYDAAKQLIQDDEGSFHSYQFSMIVYGKTEEEVSDRIREVKRIFLSYGTLCVVEKLAIEHIWRSLFPGRRHFIRKSNIFSHNLAHIIPFEKDAVGLKNSDWGKGPLRNFKTINGSNFPLNLHISDQSKSLGHNLIIAPAGSGKTTLIQHIIAGALRHKDLRVFLFDRFNGTRVFTESCGGNYIDIESGKNGAEGVKLNPFLGEDSISDKARLRRLLKLMSGLENNEINSSELNSIIDLLQGLDKDLRVFNKIHNAILEGDTPLSSKLKEWADGSFSHWFNGESKGKAYDSLSLDSSRLVGFEMTQVLGDEQAVGPLTYYILERILSVIRKEACSSWIFIDETKPMLDVPFFKSYVATLLREMRKLGGVMTLCFQSVSDIIDSGISSIIIDQCKTLFLFPNPTAKKEDYAIFNLTESEWDYIKGNNRLANKFEHTVLLKKPNESVILTIDLSSLGKHLKLYSSDNDLVQKVQKLQEREGDKWVESYLS